ncbi:uncharacterized protein [Triticum aestivum]|uniref:uncharacterized protein isoform X3 n=1 Tax=Triticum aestivum TaxID=4565 RepID=UPI001D02E1B1|nr:uncharacterized protein LOC123068821 isoform X3 [Triticum aestivum]XP_044377149.1 uncharacterized protein LOC123099078 isoform X3 [Triticum aestivum]XP_044394613.1 uncharacterized protein LOC123119034 isoform X3 [Triticum aestivum]XP_044394619.1 uncharacterized protein LOC123119036 isoform X3 [Triticum aestivum]
MKTAFFITALVRTGSGSSSWRVGFRLFVCFLIFPHLNLLRKVEYGTSRDLASALSVDLLLRGIEGILERSRNSVNNMLLELLQEQNRMAC